MKELNNDYINFNDACGLFTNDGKFNPTRNDTIIKNDKYVICIINDSVVVVINNLIQNVSIDDIMYVNIIDSLKDKYSYRIHHSINFSYSDLSFKIVLPSTINSIERDDLLELIKLRHIIEIEYHKYPDANPDYLYFNIKKYVDLMMKKYNYSSRYIHTSFHKKQIKWRKLINICYSGCTTESIEHHNMILSYIAYQQYRKKPKKLELALKLINESKINSIRYSQYRSYMVLFSVFNSANKGFDSFNCFVSCKEIEHAFKYAKRIKKIRGENDEKAK